jgi:uncharacterized membrane protein YGL010W
MKIILISLALVGLLATVLPSVLVYFGVMELETHKAVMAIGMIVWFITAPLFMKRKGSA